MRVFKTSEQYISFGIVRDVNGPIKPNSCQAFFTKLKLLIPYSTFIFGFCISSIFLINDANTFQDYSDVVYILASLLLNYSNLTILSRSNLFKLIDNFEHIIDCRKDPLSKKIYADAYDLVEKWNKIAHIAMVKLTTPLMTFPYLIASYLLYYGAGWGSDAFYMPFLSWY